MPPMPHAPDAAQPPTDQGSPDGGPVGPRVVVVQDGARLHYSVPLAVQMQGALELMYATWYVKPNWPSKLAARVAMRVDPVRGKRFAERSHAHLDAGKIRTNPLLALKIARRRSGFKTGEAFWRWEREETGAWIARAGFGSANALFGFVRNVDVTLCRRARDAGLVVVSDQMIATAREEARQERIQQERFPAWAGGSSGAEDDEVSTSVERATWEASDAVTCASEYVRSSLVAGGVPDGKISVIPYPVELSHYDFVDRSGRTGPVTVGFVGWLGLRKGTPYFLQVAERLKSANIRFALVGGTSLDRSLLGTSPNVEIVGAVPRSDVPKQLARFDVLLFPSTCEGSPGAVMEAMASGLPIVTTPNSGTVVRDGVDGFVRAYDDIEGLAGAVERLASSERERLEMGRNARERAAAFNLESYGKSLRGVFERALRARLR